MVSPKQLAIAVGVSESSLKRWADDGLLVASRTAGGHRRIALPEAVRFIRHMGLRVVHAGELGLIEGDEPLADLQDQRAVVEAFCHAMEEGDSARSKQIAQSCYLAGWSVAAIADGPIREALARIGQLWQHAEWGIVVEHRATDISLQILSMLRALMPARREGAPIALGGAAEIDPSMIPSLCASVSLAEVGFNEVNLGPMTPTSVLCNAIRHYKPHLVWLTMTHPRGRDALIKDLSAIRATAEEVGAGFIAGGRMLGELSAAELTGIAVGRSMAELVAFARGRCETLLQGDVRPHG